MCLLAPLLAPGFSLEIGSLLGLDRAVAAGALSAQASRSREQGSVCKHTVSFSWQRGSTPTHWPSGPLAGGQGYTDRQTPGRQGATLSHLCYANRRWVADIPAHTHTHIHTHTHTHTTRHRHACSNACRRIHTDTHRNIHTHSAGVRCSIVQDLLTSCQVEYKLPGWVPWLSGVDVTSPRCW